MNSAPATDSAFKPVSLRLAPEAIPAELKALCQWVVWRYEHRAGRWTKPPFRADGNGYASSIDSATWTDFDTALAIYQEGGFDGIGVALTGDLGIVGVDLDHSYNPQTKSFEPWATAIIDGFKSYIEASPSGTGVRIFVKGKLPGGGHKKGNIEIYSRGRYLTVTGRALQNSLRTVEPAQSDIDAFLAKYFPPELKGERTAAGANGNGHTHLSDHQILELAKGAKNGAKVTALLNGDVGGYPSQSEADMALCSVLAFYTLDPAQIDRIYRGSALARDKWDTKHGADTYGAMTINKAIARATETYSGKDTNLEVFREQVTAFDNRSAELRVGVPLLEDVPEDIGAASDSPLDVTFPTVAWGGLFGQWRDMVADRTEAPLPYLWAAFLQAVGLMIGRNAWRDSPRPLFPNFFVMLLGSTGDSRKSTVEWLEHELLIHLGVDVEILFGIVSTEGIIERLSQREGVKALGYADEFRSLLSVAKRKGTQDILPRLQSLYSCPAKECVDRRQNPATAISPFFSLLTATPQDFVVDLIGDLEITGGFLNRFLIVDGKEQAPKPVVEQPTQAEWHAIVQPLQKIEAEIANPRRREFEPEAAELWSEFYIEWKKRRSTWNSKAANLSARTFEHVLKISLVYSVLASEKKISARSLAIAISLGGWLESNALRLFGEVGLDNFGRAERAVKDLLHRTRNGFVYRRDLQQLAAKKNINGELFGRVIKAMEANGQIQCGAITSGAGQRRPTVQYIREQVQVSSSQASVNVLGVPEHKAKE